MDQSSFNQLGLCDASLSSLCWVADGKDLAIGLLSANGEQIELVCSFARRRSISLSTIERQGGRPLVWQAKLEQAGNQYHLHLDFGSEGEISLLCNEVTGGRA